MITKQLSNKILDFEVDRGTNAIHVRDLRQLLNLFEYGSRERAYFLMLYGGACRVSEPVNDITWHNFNDNGLLIYRPSKTSRFLPPPRKIQFSPLIWKELRYFRDNNFFPASGRIFDVQAQNFRDRLNKEWRSQLGAAWNKRKDIPYLGRVAEKGYYTISSLRCTAGTTIFSLYYRAYPNQPDLALHLTSRWMGHGKGGGKGSVTAFYYIKRIDQLGLDNVPVEALSGLELFDHVVYGEHKQTKINDFQEVNNSLLCFDAYPGSNNFFPGALDCPLWPQET